MISRTEDIYFADLATLIADSWIRRVPLGYKLATSLLLKRPDPGFSPLLVCKVGLSRHLAYAFC